MRSRLNTILLGALVALLAFGNWTALRPVKAQLQATGPLNAALINVTAVQVSGATASDQNLQQLVEAPGNLNYVGKTAKITAQGTVTSGASGNGTWTIKLKLCTVSGCGSGTALTLSTLGPTGTQIASATSAPWACEFVVTTAAVGATGNVWANGVCHVETTSVTLQTDNPSFSNVNTAVSSNIDLTGQLFWQVTLADSGASANNVINGRYLAREFIN